jgi:peptidoglycan/xylan/chitin deacetylase (PgdA/CDA1 family)
LGHNSDFDDGYTNSGFCWLSCCTLGSYKALSGGSLYFKNLFDRKSVIWMMRLLIVIIVLIACIHCVSQKQKQGNGVQIENTSVYKGAITRGDSTQKKLAIVFTGDEFGEGGNLIAQTLKNQSIKASFFFTGRFYRNTAFKKTIEQLKKDGHYLGAHSNEHLLYCDWNKRDSLLVTKQQFMDDLDKNYGELNRFGVSKKKAHFFLPPYEWYNDSIAVWTKKMGLQLINFTPGTLSHADYTTPADKNYRSSDVIYRSIVDYERKHSSGLNGFILLMHIGTDEKRTDKLYYQLPKLIQWLKAKNYQLVGVNDLLR